ncbi:hypothetical protein CALCODRAFT_484733 [Calocera cornea HHB12733]|uniref:Uncharacterized protein n=1 Tax=Calocera cornea HHB12733 TaxID=1353952 RepID=A0A165EST9_9BASI|nr:hypothetical protein CALCODRAFT_484733 [Calocera cornea HHB12733]
MQSAHRQQRVATLQPPPAPRRPRTPAVHHVNVSQAWSSQTNASSSPSPLSRPLPSSPTSLQHRRDLYTVDKAEERALDRYLGGYFPPALASASHLPTPNTPFSQSSEFDRGFPFASANAEGGFEYISSSLNPFIMNEASSLDLLRPNLSLFDDFTPPPLPGLGIRLPSALPTSDNHPPSPCSCPDDSAYHGSDITRLRDDTTYTAADHSPDSVAASSSGDLALTEGEAAPPTANETLPTEFMDMTMNMHMDIGSPANNPRNDGHTSMMVNTSTSSPTSQVGGALPGSPIASALASSHSSGLLGPAPLAFSTPLNHFERSGAPPPSLDGRNMPVQNHQGALPCTPQNENPHDGPQAEGASTSPPNLDDNPLPSSPSIRSPPPAHPNAPSGWPAHSGWPDRQEHDHDHDLDVDHDRHGLITNNPDTPQDDLMALSGPEDDADDDNDDVVPDQEDDPSHLQEWSSTTIKEWKDKLMTVVLRALPTNLEFDTIQKERLQKKNGLGRGKVTNRQANALDKGKRMFQEITRIFLDMLDVPSGVGAQRLGRWSPYLSNESPWNMWQRKWAAEHGDDNFDDERCRKAYHEFVGANPNYRDVLEAWERSHPRADGQKLTESQRLRRWSHFTREMQDRANTWEETHGFSCVILACTLVPEDKFDQFTFFHETPQMMDFSVQRLGQTNYNARLLAFHWLGDRQARKLTSHPAVGGNALITAARRRVPLPTVAKMRKIYADAVIHLEKQCAQLNPSANIQVSARARWRDWDSFLIDAGCTLRNWPNVLPWPWDLVENRGSATQALLTPLYYAVTGFNNQPKLDVTLWEEEEDPVIMTRADGTTFRLSDYEARKAAAFRPLSKAAKRLKKDRGRTRRGRKRPSYSSSSASSGSDDEEDHDHDHVARKRPRTSGKSDPPQPVTSDAPPPSSVPTVGQPPLDPGTRVSGPKKDLPQQLVYLPGKGRLNHGHERQQLPYHIVFMGICVSEVVETVIITPIPAVGGELRAVAVGCTESGAAKPPLGTLLLTHRASEVIAIFMETTLKVSTVLLFLQILRTDHHTCTIPGGPRVSTSPSYGCGRHEMLAFIKKERLRQQREYEREKRGKKRQAREEALQRLRKWKRHQRALQTIQLLDMSLSRNPLLFLATAATIVSE